MHARHYLLQSILFLSILAQPSYAAMSQSLYFNQECNPLPGRNAAVRPDSSHSRLASVPQGVELRTGIDYECYPVSGKTFSEIVASVHENGPHTAEAKRRLPAKTAWSFGISYEFDVTSALDEEDDAVHVALGVKNVRVAYYTTITLPYLIDNSSLNPIERNLWKSLFLQFLEHEYDRLDIIKDSDTADEAKKNLTEINYLIVDYREGLDIEKTIGAFLQDEALKAAKDMSGRIRERLNEYDRLTDYGKKHSQRDSFFGSKKR
jgi:predicted secreted Zn-dependent protease